MALFSAYLRFNGNCKEAMEFYKRCLGGELNLMTMGQSPMAAQTPANQRDKVMHSLLVSGYIRIMGSDMVGHTEEYRPGNAVAFTLVGETRGEIEKLFKALSAGGKVTTLLKQEFFGTYGALTDKYGFDWMFQYGEMKQ